MTGRRTPDSVRVVRILVTNDDGWDSRGLAVLEEIASEFGEVFVVAPERDRSGIGQAITLKSPLRLLQVDERRYKLIDGTPTDCVYVGFNRVLQDEAPGLVLSGINPGPNLGWDVLYSGTSAAAREAVLQGAPAIGVSLLPGGGFPYEAVAPWIRRVIERTLATGLPPFVCLNVNIPNPNRGAIRGIRATCLGQRYYSKEVDVRTDPRGGEYLWIGGRDVHMPDIPGSDCNAVRERYVSVTPISCDMSCSATRESMVDWDEEGP